VNDDQSDIEGFIALCDRLKVNAVDVTRDVNRATTPFGDRTINAVAWMLHELQALGIKASAPDYAFSGTPHDRRSIDERLTKIRLASSASPLAGPLGAI